MLRTKRLAALLLVSSAIAIVLLQTQKNKLPQPIQLSTQTAITNSSDSSDAVVKEMSSQELYDITFSPRRYNYPYDFYTRDNSLYLWNRSDTNEIGAASLLNLDTASANIGLFFEKVYLPETAQGFALIERATSEREEYVFYQAVEVCGDACIEGKSNVVIYYRSFADLERSAWTILSNTLPFETPSFTNFVPVIHDNYLYVIQVDKNALQNPVYRAYMNESGNLTPWEDLNPLPQIEANAYFLSYSMAIDGNNIYFPYSFTKIYTGVFDSEGQIAIKYLVEVPWYSYIFSHNNTLHFISNIVDEQKTKVTNKIGKVDFANGANTISYYPEQEIAMDLADYRFDARNFYYKQKLYTIINTQSFATGASASKLAIQLLPL